MTELATVFGKRILLAEDEPTVRESIKLMLNLDQHKVTEASNGREALALFSAEQFDLVITDYLMPQMHGDELARSVKQIAPSQPVLIVTAYAEKLIDSGKPADMVLGKPIALADLRQAIARPARTAAPPSIPGDPSPTAFPQLAPPPTGATRQVRPTNPGPGSDTSFLRGWGIND
jgi:CheY-like chemotaxis protein